METPEPVQAQPKSGNNRIWIIVGIVVLICCCLSVIAALAAGPVILRSIQSVGAISTYSGRADDLLKSDTMAAITQYEDGANNCTDVTLFNGYVIVAPEQTGDGSWTEMWQVMACGNSHLYSVTFTPSPTGGTDFSVSPADQ